MHDQSKNKIGSGPGSPVGSKVDQLSFLDTLNVPKGTTSLGFRNGSVGIRGQELSR